MSDLQEYRRTDWRDTAGDTCDFLVSPLRRALAAPFRFVYSKYQSLKGNKTSSGKRALHLSALETEEAFRQLNPSKMSRDEVLDLCRRYHVLPILGAGPYDNGEVFEYVGGEVLKGATKTFSDRISRISGNL